MTIRVADFDLEANNYLRGATIVWCGVAYLSDIKEWRIYHVDTEEYIEYPMHSKRVSIEDFIEMLYEYKPSAYNGLGYDFPLLCKLHGFNYKPDPSTLIDPLIMSRLSYPDRDGHSLDAWGERFAMHKGGHKDFTKFSNEMLQYCIQDTRILKRTREYLEQEMSDWDWGRSLLLEYSMQHIQTKQETNGVLFDKDKAEALLAKIQLEIADIEAKVIPAIPQKVVDMGEVRKPFLKSGEYSETTKRWLNVPILELS